MKQCTAPRRTVQELEAELAEDDEEGEHVMFMVESSRSSTDEGELHIGEQWIRGARNSFQVGEAVRGGNEK